MKPENNEHEQERAGKGESPRWSVGSLAWRHWEAPYSGAKEAAPGPKTRMRLEDLVEMSGLLTETARLFGARRGDPESLAHAAHTHPLRLVREQTD